jgi:hypothetical protein
VICAERERLLQRGNDWITSPTVDSTPNPHAMPENSHIELVEEHDQDLAGRNQIVQSLKRSAADDFVLAELGVVSWNPFCSIGSDLPRSLAD